MKNFICVFFFMFLIVWSANLVTAQIKFDPANPDNSEKTVKKLLNAKIDDLKKNNVKKIIISGCKGEFILSKTTAPGAWESKDMMYYNKHQIQEKIKTKESWVLNQEYCVDLTSRLLDAVIAMFKEAGIEVVPAETWQKSEVYQEMLKLMMDYDKDEGTKYGMFSQNVTTRTLAVPAYDYRLEPENVFKMIKYQNLKNQSRGKMLIDNDAQAFCNITLKIDGVNSKPNLTGLELLFETGMKQYKTGTKDKDGNQIYSYSLSSFPVMAIKDIIVYNNDVKGSKQFLDVQLYDKAVVDMYSYVLSIYKDKIKEVITSEK